MISSSQKKTNSLNYPSFIRLTNKMKLIKYLEEVNSYLFSFCEQHGEDFESYFDQIDEIHKVKKLRFIKYLTDNLISILIGHSGCISEIVSIK